MKVFDENEAISFIRDKIYDKSLSDQQILDVIDIIYEYYDQSGGLDLDIDFDDDEEDIDDSAEAAIITQYIINEHPDLQISNDTINQIIMAEIDYETSLFD